MADRQAFRERVDVRPRFRCLVCRRFVLGTDHGTCPQCGWHPPTIRVASPTRARAGVIWLAVALAAAALIAVAVALGR